MADIAWQSMANIVSIGGIASGDEWAFFDSSASAVKNATTDFMADWVVANKVSAIYIKVASAADFLSEGASANWVTIGSAASYITSMGDDGSPDLGGNLNLGDNYFSANITGASGAQGAIVITLSAGEAVSAFKTYYLKSDGLVYKTDADAVASAMVMGITLTLASAAGSTVEVTIPGPLIIQSSWNWTPGVPLYLGTTAGDLTSTAPTGSTDVQLMFALAVKSYAIAQVPGYNWGVIK